MCELNTSLHTLTLDGVCVNSILAYVHWHSMVYMWTQY